MLTRALRILVTLVHDSMEYNVTSGDENHLCGVSLRKSHKISLKAHRHVCTRGVCTPIARCKKLKLPRQ